MAELSESTCSITSVIFPGEETPVCPERDIHRCLQVCLLLIWKLQEPSELVLQDTSNTMAAREHSHSYVRAFKRKKKPSQGCRGTFQAPYPIAGSLEKPVTSSCPVPSQAPLGQRTRHTKRMQHCFQRGNMTFAHIHVSSL